VIRTTFNRIPVRCRTRYVTFVTYLLNSYSYKKKETTRDKRG